jgi:hypothetical protein
MQDKSEIFRYLALKLSIKKTSLLKRCRRLLEKDQSDILLNTNPLQIKHQPCQQMTPQKQHNEINIIETVKQQYLQQQQQQQLQQQHHHQQQQQSKINHSIDENSLEPDLKEKILYVVQIFNQTNPREFTFEVNNYLNSIDSQARKLYNKEIVSQIYDYLASSFKIDKEKFLKKLNFIRSEFNEKQLKNSINKFKFELSKEMKHLEEKHNQAYLEFVKRLNELQVQQQQGQQLGEQEKKKIFGPRKKFIWSNELKEMFKNVLTNLMNLYELKDVKVLDKATYLREFLSKDIINAWPEGWMQITVLINESELLLGMKVPTIKKSPQMTATNRVQNNDEKPVKISNYNDNGVQNRQSNQNTSSQARKVVPERVQNSSSSNQQVHQHRQQQQQASVVQQQRSQTNTPSQQRAQNFQNISPSQKIQNSALNQLSTASNLTQSQQKLLQSSSTTSMNSFISSILATSNIKAEGVDIQQHFTKQLQSLYSNTELASKATSNNSSQSVNPFNNFQKHWSATNLTESQKGKFL